MTPTFQYPGVDLPLRGLGYERFESSPIYPIGFPEYRRSKSATLHMREVAMMMLMDKLTDKHNWHEKVFDETIVAKWRDEARQQPEDGLFAMIMQGKESAKIPKPRSRIISEQAFEFCIAELRDKARYFIESGLIPTLDAPKNSIVKSDSYVDEALHNDLLRSFSALQADQAKNIDWHPRSGDMVQDLVHPSMYTFVYDRSYFIQDEVIGVSNALDFIGQGEPVKGESRLYDHQPLSRHNYNVGSGRVAPEYWSHTYQWLPANVGFRADGTAEFTSYVNNLHPNKFPSIYMTLEKVIDKAIFAWDQCLRETIDYGNENYAGRKEPRFEVIENACETDESWSPDFSVDEFKDMEIKFTDRELRYLDKRAGYNKGKGRFIKTDPEEDWRRSRQGLPPLCPNMNDEDWARAKWEKYKEAVLPEPKAYEPVDYVPKQTLREKFKETGLQIIVKMASIELTPEKPEFPAGGWHLEGQMNEKIAATALYYLDSENVTPSYLSFRMQTDSYLNNDVYTDQGEYNWLERVLGTSLGPSSGFAGSCTQNYGDVETRQGRLLAFPNVFQHRVSSFKLQDPTKPGHRRFVALWLIDPHRRVISTANVPPQQKDWWVGKQADESAVTQSDGDIPKGLMTVEEAREHRLKLMDERTAEKVKNHWEGVEYSFCEH